MSPDSVTSDSVIIIPNASLYHFAILVSSMHQAWIRYVCGRHKSDYRYSVSVVYNTFPWPSVLDKDKTIVSELGQRILDTRDKYLRNNYSLAYLYNIETMPSDLLNVHRQLDTEVDRLYATKSFNSDTERLECLFALYNKLTRKLV